MTIAEYFKGLLEIYRGLADTIQRDIERLETDYAQDPQRQAEDIAEGKGYQVCTAVMLLDAVLSNSIDASEWSGGVVDEEKKRVINDVKLFLRREYGSPDEALRQRAMKSVGTILPIIEMGLLINGYELPEWERPAWLQEMENDRKR